MSAPHASCKKFKNDSELKQKTLAKSCCSVRGVLSILLVLVVFQSSKQIDKHGSEEFVIIVPLLRNKNKTLWA